MAVEDAFGANVNFAQLIKLYEHDEAERERYSPSDIVRVVPTPISGNPKPWLISSSYVERQNLTFRLQLRRFTKLTKAFSKKLTSLRAVVVRHYAHYNFVRIHSSVRVTRAMAAGIIDHLWTLDRMVSHSLD